MSGWLGVRDWSGELPDLAVGDRARHAAAVEQRGVGREALLAHQLLAEEVAVVVAELRVALAGQPAECSVVGHRDRPIIRLSDTCVRYLVARVAPWPPPPHLSTSPTPAPAVARPRRRRRDLPAGRRPAPRRHRRLGRAPRRSGTPTWSAASCSATPTCPWCAASPRPLSVVVTGGAGQVAGPLGGRGPPGPGRHRPGDRAARPRRPRRQRTTRGGRARPRAGRGHARRRRTRPRRGAGTAHRRAGWPRPTRSPPPTCGSSCAWATSTTRWSPTSRPSPPGSTRRSTARPRSSAPPACTAPSATTPRAAAAHGFLNVLVATQVLWDGGSVADATDVLRERDGAALAAHDLSSARRWFTSFGSCSVTEPLDDLVALGLAPRHPTPSEDAMTTTPTTWVARRRRLRLRRRPPPLRRLRALRRAPARRGADRRPGARPQRRRRPPTWSTPHAPVRPAHPQPVHGGRARRCGRPRRAWITGLLTDQTERDLVEPALSPVDSVTDADALQRGRLRRLLRLRAPRLQRRAHLPPRLRAAAAELEAPAGRLPRPLRHRRGLGHRRRTPVRAAQGAHRGRRRPTAPRRASTSRPSSASSSACRPRSASASPPPTSPATPSASSASTTGRRATSRRGSTSRSGRSSASRSPPPSATGSPRSPPSTPPGPTCPGRTPRSLDYLRVDEPGRARHRDRGGARRRGRRPPALPHRCTGRRPRCSRTPRSTAPPSAPATCGRRAPSRAPSVDQRGSLLELSWGGKEPFTAGGRERTFLEDGDEVTLRYTAPGTGGGPDRARRGHRSGRPRALSGRRGLPWRR